MPTLSPEEIYNLCLSVGFSPDESVTMTAIALAESGGHTDAHNGHGEDSWGLWQVNIGAGGNHDQWGDLTNPVNNARAAYDISRGGSSISPWTTTHDSNAGTAHDYRNFMDEARAASGGQYQGYDQGVAGYGSPLRGAGMPGDGEGIPGAGHAPDLAGTDVLHPPDPDPGHSAGVEAFLHAATAQQGDRYVFGAEADVHDTNPDVFDCCLAAGSLVVTDRGALPIEEVEPGDVVLSWNDGSAERRKVVGVLDQGEQPVFRLETRSRSAVATSNHPFLVVRAAGSDWSAEWTPLDGIAAGDLIVVLDHLDIDGGEVALADGTPVTPEVAWLLGALMDGFVGTASLLVRKRGDVRDRVRSTMLRTWGLGAEDAADGGLRVGLTPSVSAALQDAIGADRISDRRVPSLVWQLPATGRRAYLDGHRAGSDWTGRVYASSRQLAHEIRMLQLLLGDDVRTMVGESTGGWCYEWTCEPAPHSAVRLPDGRFRVEPVIGITAAGVASTWDIEVEGAHNFVADGVVVHNSELVQWAAGQVGIDLPDGSWVQYLQLKGEGATISVDQALHTPGAILFSFSSEPTQGGGRPSHAHVAISLGDGRTIEARGTQYGVGEFDAGNRFQYAAVLPGLDDAVAADPAAAAALLVDTDHDGISDYDELSLGLDPNVADSDHDGLLDGFEHALGLNALSADSDNDGLSDAYELSRSHTNPLAADTDGDGVNDNMELLRGTDAIQGVHFQLGDGAATAGAFGLGMVPDTDNDGLSDAREAALGSNANDADSDHDGVKDSVEYAAGTNLMSADSDGDGLSDSFELSLGTDPLSADTDHDGIFDGAELSSGGDPLTSALHAPGVAPPGPALPLYESVVGAAPATPAPAVGLPALGGADALDPLHHPAVDHHAGVDHDDDADDDDDFDDIVGP